MVALRNEPRTAEFAVLGLATLIFLLTPTPIGHQDLAALIAQQPSVAARGRQHLMASPFGTIHAATFSYPRPVGTAIPEPPLFRLASFNPGDDVVGSIGKTSISKTPLDRGAAPLVFPTVNRAAKGDRLVPVAPAPRERETAGFPEPPDVALPDVQAEIEDALLRAMLPAGVPAVAPAPPIDEGAAAVRGPAPEYDVAMSLELDPPALADDAADLADIDPAELTPNAPPSLEGLNTAVKDSHLYFGNNPIGTVFGAVEPWAVGEEPILMQPRAPADPDIKRTAVAPTVEPPKDGSKPEPGVTIAGKGEVTGEGRRPKSPAEQLNLAGAKRAKAEKCLANAVYFEARSEPVRGQIAVAQVVMNRAFSTFYPNDVCGVVYQNAHRHLACQFTFACDGIPDVVNDAESWERAKTIAKETLDGKLWLSEVGKATHYHASYVNPWWVRAMRKHAKIGLHHFYRPRKWGDGAEAPIWGSPAYTAEVAAKL